MVQFLMVFHYGRRIWTVNSRELRNVTYATASSTRTLVSYQNCPVKPAKRNSMVHACTDGSEQAINRHVLFAEMFFRFKSTVI